MNLHRLLLQREAAHNPLRVGLIGAGKFGSKYLAPVCVTPGIHLVAIVDLSASRAREAGMRTGWPAEAIDSARRPSPAGCRSAWPAASSSRNLWPPASRCAVRTWR